MNPIAIQIGAGNIGRGFIAQLYHESGYQIRFIDANTDLVGRLNAAREYAIEIAAESPVPPITIDNYRAHHVSETEAISEALLNADIASVSAGALALHAVARMLAEVLEPRLRAESAPLNILVCENPPGQAEALREVMKTHLPDDLHATIDERIGFVDTVIGRMVPVMEDPDSLNVRVEPYCELPVDADAVVGELPRISHLHAESPFEFWIERKLYMHNAAHAATAYLGHLRRHEYVHEAIGDPGVHVIVHGILEEVAQALSGKYGASLEELRVHGSDLLTRFENRALRDTVERVARDPMRKLSPNERFMRAAACCLAQGVDPPNLAVAAAAAIRYDHPSDPAAATLQAMLRDEGWDTVLEKVCELPPESPFARRIMESGLGPAPDNESRS